MNTFRGYRAVLRIGMVLIGVAALCPVVHAESFSIGVYGAGAQPQGDFGDQADDTAPGFDVQGFYRLPMAPLSVGLEIGYLRYGSDHRIAPFSPTISEVMVRVSRHNQILRSALLLRYERPYGRVTPHVEGALGLHHLWTAANIEDREFHIPLITSTIVRDTAPALGIGGGIRYEVYHDEKDKVSVALDTQVRYTLGGEATYLTEGDITVTTDGELITDEHETRTDLLDIRVGLVIMF